MKIQHDFHIHTSLSKCANETATVENYLRIAEKKGLKKIGFANHMWDKQIEGAIRWYRNQDYEHLLQLKSEIEKVEQSEIKIYFGCETEYDFANHSVAITEKTAEKFDFVLVPHSHTHMIMPKVYYEPYQRHVDFMIQAYEDIINSRISRYITAMAHPFEAVACPYDKDILIRMISDDCFKRLFDKTAEKGIAVEINMGGLRKKTISELEKCPEIRMFQIARDCGCRFIFGSDAHSDQAHEGYEKAQIIADLLALTEEKMADIAKSG